MSKISQKKMTKIKENILAILFDNSPKALYTNRIGEELCRDEEFIKKLLEELHKEKLVTKITKNSRGKSFLARRKWQLSDTAYNAYKKLV